MYVIFLSAALLATLCILKKSACRLIGSGRTNRNRNVDISEVMAKNSSPLRNQLSSSVIVAFEEELSTTSSSINKSSTTLFDLSNNKNSPYTKAQTLSFQIYTGGAPALISDESNPSLKRRNHECKGLHSYGKSGDDDPEAPLQCYLGLENTALDVERRLGVMMDAVNKAYDVSDKDESILKVGR